MSISPVYTRCCTFLCFRTFILTHRIPLSVCHQQTPASVLSTDTLSKGYTMHFHSSQPQPQGYEFFKSLQHDHCIKLRTKLQLLKHWKFIMLQRESSGSKHAKLRYALIKTLRDSLGIFPNMRGGGSFQFPKVDVKILAKS